MNDYTYKEDPLKCMDSRYLHRGKFQWGKAGNIKDATTVEGKIFQSLSRLENIRKQEGVFSSAAEVYTYDVKEDSILCILREMEGRRFFGIFNFSDVEKTAWMQEDGEYINLMGEGKIELKDVVLPAHGFIWAIG